MSSNTAYFTVRALTLVAVGSVFTLSAADLTEAAEDDVVRVGKGSYALMPPSGTRLPPKTIYRTANVAGPMPTTDWWSSLAWERYSSNQFPHPLAVCATKDGLRISYPGARIHSVAKHTFASMHTELVLGHSQCGGVAGCHAMCSGAAPELEEKSSFVGRWMDILRPGYDRVSKSVPEADQVRALEHEAVVVSLENLMTFPFVKEAVEADELSLHGLWTDLGAGGLSQYDPQKGVFEPL